ncbi:MAG: dihydrodipicolinate reductase [Dehalococcoidia bacterium]
MTTRPWNVEPYVQRQRIRTIHYGIGAIGSEVVRLVMQRPEIEIVGAIDTHAAKAGKDLGQAVGLNRPVGITVSPEAEPILKDVYADVVIHATASSLTEAYPQLKSIVSAEKSVVSSCEELAFPWVSSPEISHNLDRIAREAGVRVLGTGVNPGFLMDFLPLVLTTTCEQVKSVRVRRTVDVATRRFGLQRKVGVGLSVEGFQRGVADGSIGHVGLRESVFMIADTLGWHLDDVSESLEPVVAEERITTNYFLVEHGYVAGLRQIARGLMSEREVVRLDLEMSLGATDPRDSIEIDGNPPVNVNIPGGLKGDLATAAIMANCLPTMAWSRMVGLLSMRDMPAVPYFRPRPQPREELG